MSTLAPRVRQPLTLRTIARSRWVAPAMGALGGAIAFAGAGNPSYWGDEAASVMSAQRSLPSLFGELAHIDAVHGLYYLFLHFWVGAFGTSEAVVRFPSAVAAGLAIAGTVALGRLLLGASGGIVAGAVVAVLPELTRMAIEARSYAFGMAAAVWLTWLLVTLVRRRETRRRLWAVYAIGAALSVYLFLYLALLVVVHLVALIVERAPWPIMRRWLQALALAGVAVLPFAAVAIGEQHQVAFLAHRDYATALNVLVRQWFHRPVIAVVAWSLIITGVAITGVISRHRAVAFRRGQLVAVTWVVLPTAILLAGNAWIEPMYNMRYAAFCTPGVALAIAAGIVQVARFGGDRATRILIVISLFVVVAAVAAPSYLAQRGPYAKDGGSDLRVVAQTVASNARPGDAVVFDQTLKPSRKLRLALDLYPADFAAVDDIALLTPAAQRTALWDEVAPIDALAPELAGHNIVWAVEAKTTAWNDLSVLRAHGYAVTRTIELHRTVVYQLTKETR